MDNFKSQALQPFDMFCYVLRNLCKLTFMLNIFIKSLAIVFISRNVHFEETFLQYFLLYFCLLIKPEAIY